jgi:hypothetical protein
MALFSPQARDTYVGVDMYIDGSWTRTYELRAEGDQVLETFFCRQRERKKILFLSLQSTFSLLSPIGA